MKVILLPRSTSRARHIEISVPAVVAGICLPVAVIVGGLAWYMAGSISASAPLAEVTAIQADIEKQRDEIDALRGRTQEQLDALAIRMGDLNARAIRLDALGSRLTDMADLDDGEFDFDSEPAVGGPLEPADGRRDGDIADVLTEIESMDKALHDQEQQLSILEGLLMTRKLNERVSPRGRPVKSGYISSYFGMRKTRSRARARVTAASISPASATASYRGGGRRRHVFRAAFRLRQHGRGQSRQRLRHPLCAQRGESRRRGDQVQPGQTHRADGVHRRATGPNLHFEVRHRGRPVDPVRFIRQTS